MPAVSVLDLFGPPEAIVNTPSKTTPRRHRRKTNTASRTLTPTLVLFGLTLSVNEPWTDDPPTEESLPGQQTTPQVETAVLAVDPGPVGLPQLPTPAPVAVSTKQAPTKPLGIDLENRGHEVKKLLHAGFGLKMKAKGYDPDDVLQEIYKGLLTRNNGKCPFDPTKSSFGHYVHMVCDCVLKNYHRKMARRAQFEIIGLKLPPSMLPGSQDKGWTTADAALAATSSEVTGLLGQASTTETDPAERVASAMATNALDRFLEIEEHNARRNGDNKQATLLQTARHTLPLKAQGMTRAEIAEQLQMPLGQISKALATLRNGSKAWAVQQGLRTA